MLLLAAIGLTALEQCSQRSTVNGYCLILRNSHVILMTAGI